MGVDIGGVFFRLFLFFLGSRGLGFGLGGKIG